MGKIDLNPGKHFSVQSLTSTMLDYTKWSKLMQIFLVTGAVKCTAYSHFRQLCTSILLVTIWKQSPSKGMQQTNYQLEFKRFKLP